MLHALTDHLLALAERLPLGAFTFVGSLIEEIIAPIPSPIVLTLAGAAAQAQAWPWTGLLWLALLGAAGKTLGATVLYVVFDKVEDVVLTRFGSFVGLSHTTVERVGAMLGKSGKDVWILLLLRATPVMPSAPLSALCGMMKIRFLPFVLTTFAGSIVRDLAFLALGYAGSEVGLAFVEGIAETESLLTLLIGGAVLAFLAWCYAKRRRWLGR